MQMIAGHISKEFEEKGTQFYGTYHGSKSTSMYVIPFINTTYSRQKFSGLSWMVKRYYFIQDYLENLGGKACKTPWNSWRW